MLIKLNNFARVFDEMQLEVIRVITCPKIRSNSKCRILPIFAENSFRLQLATYDFLCEPEVGVLELEVALE